MTSNTLHPLARPADRLLFAPNRDRYGVRLALVFGNHAPGGQCPFFTAGQCNYCDIGAGEGAAASVESNRERLAWFCEHYRQVLPEVAHLLLYNSGSLLNPQEMPVELLDEILDWARSLPAVRQVSVESRESVMKEASLRRAAEALGSGRMVRVVAGLETSDDRIRVELLAKRMSRTAIQRAVAAVGSAAADLGPERLGLTFNILVGGPGTTPQSTVDDALTTAHFALDIGKNINVSVDLNLHPYYRSPRGRLHFPDHPRCSPHTVARATAAVAEVIAAQMPSAALYVGFDDEGLDDAPAPSGWLAEGIGDVFAEFNQSQDASVLDLL